MNIDNELVYVSDISKAQFLTETFVSVFSLKLFTRK